MTVLQLTDSDVFAGTERHMLDLAMALKDLKCAVIVGCPANGVLASRAGGSGLEILSVRRERAADLSNVLILTRELRRGRINVIHAHNGRAALWGALATFIARRGKLLTTQHFLSPARARRPGWRRWISHQIHRWIGAQSTGVIAISEAVRGTILQRGEVDTKKVSTVLNGIQEPARRSPTTSIPVRESFGESFDGPLITCCARLEAEKEVGVLIAAMADVVREIPNAHCVVAGDGVLKAELEREIASLGLGGNVQLLGFRTDALEIVAAGDLFVLPSVAEPFGLSLVEAMALGKPVVATRAGGPIEIVVSGLTGLLVTPSDPRELAEAVLHILKDKFLGRSMGKNGRERFVRHFTAARMAKEILQLYRSAGDEERERPPESLPIAERPSDMASGAIAARRHCAL